MALMTKQLEVLQEKVEKLSTKQYLMMFFLSVLLLIKFILLPWFQDLKDEHSRLNQLSIVVKNPESLYMQQQVLEQKLQLQMEQAEYWENKFYVGNEGQIRIDFANQVNTWVSQFDLTLLRSKWGRVPKKQQEMYTHLKIQKYDITIRANYKQLLQFMAFIQKQSPLILVSNISISKRAVVGVATATISLNVLHEEQ